MWVWKKVSMQGESVTLTLLSGWGGLKCGYDTGSIAEKGKTGEGYIWGQQNRSEE